MHGGVRIYAEAGEDGVLVVGNFAERNPCENVGYLAPRNSKKAPNTLHGNSYINPKP